MLVTCSKCFEEKPAHAFNKNSRKTNGLQSRCRSCMNEYGNRWYRENRQHAIASSTKWMKEHRDRVRLTNMRARSRRDGKPCTLTLEQYTQLMAQTNCPICGISFSSEHIPQDPANKSLDRLDSNGGYTPDNCCCICYGCNRIKNDSTLERLEALVRWWKSKL